MDSIVLMKQGNIAVQGDYNEIKDSEEYKEFAQSGEKQSSSSNDEEDNSTTSHNEENDSDSKLENNLKSKIKEEIVIDKKGDIEEGKLSKKETRFTGQVGLGVYGFYFKNGGIFMTLLIFLLLVLMVGSKIAADWWVGQWAKDGFPELSSSDYIRIYAYFVALYGIMNFTKSIIWGMFVSVSSTNIFKKLIWNILRKPMSFFDTTPSGIILNRGTNDMEVADKDFPLRFNGFLDLLFEILASILIAVIVTPYVLIIIVIDTAIFYFNMKKYVKTSTELRRLTQISKSPILTTLNEMMQGSAVLRTYGVKDWIFKKWMKFHNRAWKVEFHEKMSENWIKIRTEFSLVTIVFVAGVLIVYGKTSAINPVTDGASLALVVTYLITLTSKLGFFVFQMSEVAKGGSVIERLQEYCDDKGLPLLDLKDFKKTLQYISNEGKDEIQEEYGRIASSSVGVSTSFSTVNSIELSAIVVLFSLTWAVIVDVPGFIAVTKPVVVTVATVSSLDDQIMVFIVSTSSPTLSKNRKLS
jgi:ABC-type multidrug transport system fused ATPase/permease subunit